MYAAGNPKTKKELKQMVKDGKQVRVFEPGPFDGQTNGEVTIEGPHYPAPHKWYATAILKDGYIVSIK